MQTATSLTLLKVAGRVANEARKVEHKCHLHFRINVFFTFGTWAGSIGALRADQYECTTRNSRVYRGCRQRLIKPDAKDLIEN